MQLFLWEQARRATWRLHNEAGVVIVALNLANARHMFKLWQQEHNCHDEACSVFLVDPDETIAVAPREHKVYVFPDAGCC